MTLDTGAGMIYSKDHAEEKDVPVGLAKTVSVTYEVAPEAALVEASTAVDDIVHDEVPELSDEVINDVASGHSQSVDSAKVINDVFEEIETCNYRSGAGKEPFKLGESKVAVTAYGAVINNEIYDREYERILNSGLPKKAIEGRIEAINGLFNQMRVPGDVQESIVRDGAMFNNAIPVPDRNSQLIAKYVGAAPNSTALDMILSTIRKENIGRRPIMGLLYRSGIAICIEPIQTTRIISFISDVIIENQDLGWRSGGLAMNGNQSIFAQRLTELIVEHISGWSADITREELLNEICITDYETLVALAGSAVWSDGFKLQMQCMDDLNSCGRAFSGMILPKDTIYPDERMLSREQLTYLDDSYTALRSIRSAKQQNKSFEKYLISKEARKAYQNKFTASVRSVFDNNALRFNLKLPTLADFLAEGNIWHNELRSVLPNTIAQGKQREEIVNANVNATNLRSYSAYIDSIESCKEDGSTSNQVTERSEIQRILGELSSDVLNDGSVFIPLCEAIRTLKAKATVVVVGINEHACPHCGASMSYKKTVKDNKTYKLRHLIPLPVDRYFFQSMRSIFDLMAGMG